MFENFIRETVAVDSIDIACVLGGSSPPVRLLHGFPQNIAMWARVAPQLTPLHHRMRGYGGSAKPTCLPDRSNYAFRAMAADQFGLMRQFGFERFHVVGHDRGGRTGHRLALDRPDAVLSLTVMDIVPTHEMFMATNQPNGRRRLLALVFPLAARAVPGTPDRQRSRLLLRNLPGRLGSHDDLDPQMLEHYRRSWCDPKMIQGSCSDYRAAASTDLAHDEADIARNVECPSLAFYGSRGVMANLFDIPAEWRKRCSRLQQADLPGAAIFLSINFPMRLPGSCSTSWTAQDEPIELAGNIRLGGAMSPTVSNPKRSTIAVIGLGSIGGVMAGCLHAADRHDVVACTRSPLQRLILDRPEGTIEVPIQTLIDPAAAEPVDWVLLCTKAQQTPSSAPWLAKLCDGRTRLAVLQNGIEHARRVAPFAGDATVVPAIVYYNGERIAADHVRLRRVSDHDLMVRDDEDGRAFAELVAGTSLRILLSVEFETLAWRKLLINIVANPITALTLQRQAVLRRDDVRLLCLGILDEAVAVAVADGACLAADEAARIMATLYTYPAEAGTSMYFDRLAGRSFEADALTGAVVAAGERNGIATPLNRAILTLLRAISDAAETMQPSRNDPHGPHSPRVSQAISDPPA